MSNFISGNAAFLFRQPFHALGVLFDIRVIVNSFVTHLRLE